MRTSLSSGKYWIIMKYKSSRNNSILWVKVGKSYVDMGDNILFLYNGASVVVAVAVDS